MRGPIGTECKTRTIHASATALRKDLISYRCTDSPNISDETFTAISGQGQARLIAVIDPKRSLKAEDTHDATRPTPIALHNARQPKEPDHQASDEEQQRLYELVGLRTMASQMPDEIQRGRTALCYLSV